MAKIIFLVIFFMEKKEKMLFGSGVKLFWKYGVRKTSVDEIVKEAGVAKETFYLYFKNKEELYKKIIDNNFSEAEEKMKFLFKSFPDKKERLVNYLVWSISYFKKNDIIRNMVLGEENYYIWDINIVYLEEKHMKILGILLSDFEKNYLDKIKFLAKLIWNFKQVLSLEGKCFKTEEEFNSFVLNYARVIVNWFFSDYEKIAKTFNLKMLEKMI